MNANKHPEKKVVDVFMTKNEQAWLVTDNHGATGVMVFAYWVDEISAAKRRLAKAGRSLASIKLHNP